MMMVVIVTEPAECKQLTTIGVPKENYTLIRDSETISVLLAPGIPSVFLSSLC